MWYPASRAGTPKLPRRGPDIALLLTGAIDSSVIYLHPFVVLLGTDGTDEAGDGLLVGEDADNFGAAFDLGKEPFKRFGRVELWPVKWDEIPGARGEQMIADAVGDC